MKSSNSVLLETNCLPGQKWCKNGIFGVIIDNYIYNETMGIRVHLKSQTHQITTQCANQQCKQ